MPSRLGPRKPGQAGFVKFSAVGGFAISAVLLVRRLLKKTSSDVGCQRQLKPKLKSPVAPSFFSSVENPATKNEQAIAKKVRRNDSKLDVTISVTAKAATVVGNVKTMIGGPSMVGSTRNAAAAMAAMAPNKPTSLSLHRARDKVSHQSRIKIDSRPGTKAPTIHTIGISGNHAEKYLATTIKGTSVSGIQIRSG